MKKNVLLIGAGRFGKHMAMQLNQLGHQVMAVDTDENRINDVMNIVTNAQIGDSTNAEFLKSLGVGNFDVCMVTIGNSFQNSLETTSLLKELGARYVVGTQPAHGALAQTVVGHHAEEGAVHTKVSQCQCNIGLAAAVAGLKAGCHTDLLVVRRGQAQHDLTAGDEFLAGGIVAKDRVEMFHNAPPDIYSSSEFC